MKWITAARGVRYYEHATQKHGIKPDRFYVIYFRRNGKQVFEKIGWASEGWTLDKVIIELNNLKANYRTGVGPVTLKEKRELEAERKEVEKAERQLREKTEITFVDLFEKHYVPQQVQDNKKSLSEEKRLFDNWIQPVIGDMRLIDIAPIHFERIKSNMKTGSKREGRKTGLSERSIHYCLAVCRQVFNFAIKRDFYEKANPVSKVRKPTADNRRMRFLTHAEAEALLLEIKKTSMLTYRITLVSLHCGLRFGEIAGLKWQDLDFENDVILIRDPKNGQTRAAYMTGAVRDMFSQMEPGAASDLIFPNHQTKHERMLQIPDTFMKAVNTLKLNEHIDDRRLKVCFHTCRHSFASWLVADGASLFEVRELMGHKSLAMTNRYSHLAPDKLRNAVKSMEKAIQAGNGQEQGRVIKMRKSD